MSARDRRAKARVARVCSSTRIFQHPAKRKVRSPSPYLDDLWWIRVPSFFKKDLHNLSSHILLHFFKRVASTRQPANQIASCEPTSYRCRRSIGRGYSAVCSHLDSRRFQRMVLSVRSTQTSWKNRSGKKSQAWYSTITPPFEILMSLGSSSSSITCTPAIVRPCAMGEPQHHSGTPSVCEQPCLRR